MATTPTPAVRVRIHFDDSRFPGDRETFADIADNGKVIQCGPLHTWANQPGVTLGYLVDWLKTRNARVHSVIALDPAKQTLVDQLAANPERLPTTFQPNGTSSGLSPMTERVIALEAVVAALTARVAALEARPVIVPEVKAARKPRKTTAKEPIAPPQQELFETPEGRVVSDTADMNLPF